MRVSILFVPFAGVVMVIILKIVLCLFPWSPTTILQRKSKRFLRRSRRKAVEGEKVNSVKQNSLSEIVGIESQQLHGDLLTVTRKKRQQISSVFESKKARVC